MKLQENKVKIHKSEEFEETSFGIRSQSDLVHIFDVLRNKLYTNKILAVIREYSTNAMDSHVDGGEPKKPIQVTLPTRWDLNFSIRDFGGGLSDEDIRQVYVMYGASTKRNSNEFNGQLGFGCKAGFSYGDSFQITSYMDGVARSYECYIDETKIGKIALLDSRETTEENGIKVTIPVKESDVQAFKSTAREFYTYFVPRPNIANLGDPITEIVYQYEGTNWKYRQNGNGRAHAIMGNIRYPLDISLLRKEVPQAIWNEISIVADLAIDFNFGIGQLSIAANREGLEYDKLTIKHIAATLQQSHGELLKLINDRMAKVDDIFEAKKLYGELFSYGGALNAFKGVAGRSGITWNGKKITNDIFSYDHHPGLQLHIVTLSPRTQAGISRTNHGNGSNYRSSHGWRPDPGMKIFIQDATSKWQLRAQKYLEDNQPTIQRLLVFVPSDSESKRRDKATGAYSHVKATKDENWKEFLAETHLEDKHFLKMSEQEAKVVAPRAKHADANARTKHKAKVFRIASSSNGHLNSSNWETCGVDIHNETGVYVVLNRFRPVIKKGGEVSTLANLQTLLKHVKNLTKVDLEPDLIAVKDKLQSKLDKTKWVRLEDKIFELVSPLVTKELINQQALYEFLQSPAYSYRSVGRWRAFAQKIPPDQLDPDDLVHQVWILLQRNSTSVGGHDALSHIQRNISKDLAFFDKVEKEKEKFSKNVDILKQRYPMMADAFTNNRSTDSTLANYVAQMDLLNSGEEKKND